jgi:PII-like signaling protein
VAPVRRLVHQAQRVHVVFNNNLRDQGIRGATLFSGLLGL